MNATEAAERVDAYIKYLEEKELSQVTIGKYRRDIADFLQTQGNSEFKKQNLIDYRMERLKNHQVSSVNSYIISINQFFRWLGHGELAVKTLRLQRRSGLENVLNREEYFRLLQTALSSGRHRDYLLLRTLAATGIRVSELSAITCEAVSQGSTELEGKKKFRKIYLPETLIEELLDYCAKHELSSGPIFRGQRSGKPLLPSSVWKIIKRTAQRGGVDLDKAYPHSLRHLFAKTYMRKVGNIFELADLLGHSSVETTRIYARSSCEEEWHSVNALGL